MRHAGELGSVGWSQAMFAMGPVAPITPTETGSGQSGQALTAEAQTVQHFRGSEDERR
jgi:hypothetical protein